MTDCIFCKIIKGEIPSTKVYEDDLVYAFEDIQPQAKVHTLIVPKTHIPTLNELKDTRIWDAMLNAVHEVARIKGVTESGYRTIINCGKDGTQLVIHVHLHLMGGEQLQGKMG